MFWLLSDRALYLVAGGADGDWAFRIPYECVEEMVLDFDDNVETLPWHVRLVLRPAVDSRITTLDESVDPGNPLAAPFPRIVGDDELERLARGEIVPLAGIAAIPRRFRSTLSHHLAASGATFHLHGEDRAEAQRRHRARKR